MRTCGWDGEPIPATARPDAVFCSKRCRQAAWRTRIGRTVFVANRPPARLAYADPPYPGMARRHYADHPDYAGEVDHVDLLRRLQGYDGWALSTSASALPLVLGLADRLGIRGIRVAAWVRGSRPHWRAGIRNAWEPVLYHPVARGVAEIPTRPIEDVLLTQRPRRRPTLPGNVIGMKRPEYLAWVFELMGAAQGDTLEDLYPGSGIVGRTWLFFQGVDPSRSAAATRPGDRHATATLSAS